MTLSATGAGTMPTTLIVHPFSLLRVGVSGTLSDQRGLAGEILQAACFEDVERHHSLQGRSIDLILVDPTELWCFCPSRETLRNRFGNSIVCLLSLEPILRSNQLQSMGLADGAVNAAMLPSQMIDELYRCGWGRDQRFQETLPILCGAAH
jgi:hypothetical protein